VPVRPLRERGDRTMTRTATPLEAQRLLADDQDVTLSGGEPGGQDPVVVAADRAHRAVQVVVGVCGDRGA